MKKQISNKKYIIICCVFVVSLMIIAMSISFAYLKLDVSGVENATETKIETGTFDIKTSLTNVNAINATNIMLINEDEIEAKANSISFTVQAASTTNKAGKFNIYLKDIVISKGMIDSNFKWQLLMDGKIIGDGNFANIENDGIVSSTNTNTDTINYYDTFYLKEDIEFNGFNESSLELRVYLLNDSSVNQNNLLNGTFEAKIGIEGYSVE